MKAAQCRAIMRLDRTSVVIEGAATERPAIEAKCPEGPGIFGKTTLSDRADQVLPPRETKRWSSRRKAAVLIAVRTGVVSSPTGRRRSIGPVCAACS
jgi:hypothetical protein